MSVISTLFYDPFYKKHYLLATFFPLPRGPAYRRYIPAMKREAPHECDLTFLGSASKTISHVSPFLSFKKTAPRHLFYLNFLI